MALIVHTHIFVLKLWVQTFEMMKNAKLNFSVPQISHLGVNSKSNL